MWQVRKATLDPDTESWRLRTEAGEELSFSRVFLHWRTDADFRAFWSESLREVPFDCYCWECPRVTTSNLTQAFECVFVSSPLLAGMPPDSSPFAEYFGPGCSVATFESLGGDALLVAPCPGKRGEDFAHLSRFVATASSERKDALWKAVGEALETRIGTDPIWLSTAGLGVSWLHVRLDSRPKYYRHSAYR